MKRDEERRGDDEIFCDVCGARIDPGDVYYTMPDGMTVCAESDCTEAWLEDYAMCVPVA